MLKDSPFELLNCEELPGNPGKSLDRWKQGPAPTMDKCLYINVNTKYYSTKYGSQKDSNAKFEP